MNHRASVEEKKERARPRQPTLKSNNNKGRRLRPRDEPRIKACQLPVTRTKRSRVMALTYHSRTLRRMSSKLRMLFRKKVKRKVVTNGRMSTQLMKRSREGLLRLSNVIRKLIWQWKTKKKMKRARAQILLHHSRRPLRSGTTKLNLLRKARSSNMMALLTSCFIVPRSNGPVSQLTILFVSAARWMVSPLQLPGSPPKPTALWTQMPATR